MKRKLKAAGLVVGLLGLVAGWLHLTGHLRDRDKVMLAERIRTTDNDIPRSTPGVTKLLQVFPPPVGVDPATVTAVAVNVYQTPDPYPVDFVVKYVTSQGPTAAVGTYEDIRRWSEQSIFGWLSWALTVLGWLVVVATEIHERLSAPALPNNAVQQTAGAPRPPWLHITHFWRARRS